LKIQDGGGRHTENHKNRNGLTDLYEIGVMMQNGPRNLSDRYKI